jgi:hypothetical protein
MEGVTTSKKQWAFLEGERDTLVEAVSRCGKRISFMKANDFASVLLLLLSVTWNFVKLCVKLYL